MASFLLLSLAPGCIGPGDDVGRLPAESAIAFGSFPTLSDECRASGRDYHADEVVDPPVLRANVRLRGDSAQIGMWTARMNVTWHAWPTEEPVVGPPSGSSPGDRHLSERWESGSAPDRIVTDELRAEWTGDDFELHGSYRATVLVEMHYETWDGTAWQTACRRSHESLVELGWEG